MRILILAAFVKIGTIHGMTHGLDECGIEWEGIPIKPHECPVNVRTEKFAELVINKSSSFDTVFIGKGSPIPLNIFRRITENCDTTYWTPDSVGGNGCGPPGRPEDVGARGLLCNRIICTGTEGSKWFRENGFRGRIAQIYQGCRHSLWKPGEYPRKDQDRICFLGSGNYNGDGGRRAKLKALANAGYKIFQSNKTYHRDAAETYWNSAICPNFVCGDITSNRVVRILASGGFCLTESNVDIEHSFEDGEELAIFKQKDIPDMLNQVAYYMENPGLRESIAMCGHEWSKERTWTHQMDKMVRFIKGENIAADGAAENYTNLWALNND